ncbi:MAG: hypothetical protein JF606_14545 [Burkholderiales bacterium]|jgi:hypothetical protein|nr:hypothetical protein [Burkholderiales bacterium]
MTDPQPSLIATRLEFQEALRAAFIECARIGSREIWMCDEDFADWPLNDGALIDALTQWAMPHRKLTVLARDYDEMLRKHPRWVEWRRTWSHVVECRAQEEAENRELPTLLLAPSLVCVRLFDRIHFRGSVSRDTGDILRNRELIDAVSQRSVESFPASTLGL